jgi:hypothetical protein
VPSARGCDAGCGGSAELQCPECVVRRVRGDAVGMPRLPSAPQSRARGGCHRESVRRMSLSTSTMTLPQTAASTSGVQRS